MFCPKCGTENRPNARFCKSCGHAFGGGQPGASGPLTGSSPIEHTFVMRSVGPDDPGRTNTSIPAFSAAEPPSVSPPLTHPTDNGGRGQTDGFILGEISSPNVRLEPPSGAAAEVDAVPELFHRSTEPPSVPLPPPPPPPPPTMMVIPPAPSAPLSSGEAVTLDPLATIPGDQAAFPPPVSPPIATPTPPSGSPATTATPPSGVPLPPEVAATPFRPVEPLMGAPRPMGRSQVLEPPAPPPKPPADLFVQAAPTAPPVRSKSALGLVIGLSVAAVVLALGVVAVIAYFQLAVPPPAPAADAPPSAAEPPPVVNEPPKPAAPEKSAVPDNMILIPGGEYAIGRNAGEFFDPYEKPQHTVTLRPFYIDKTEVTNEDYQKFIEATGHPAPPSWPDGKFEPGKGLFPVTSVTLADAEAYAKWAGKRLPTEEEWEVAAHGRKPTIFPWGDVFDRSRANVKAADVGGPARVGAYPLGASPFGVLDMTGNVWEWTASEARLYPGSTEKPPSWDKPLAPGVKLQIIRGGAFTEETRRCTVTYRNWVPSDFRARELGFRCAMDQPPQ